MVPLYDEAIEPTLFDYSQTPEAADFELCQCSDNRTCDSDAENR